MIVSSAMIVSLPDICEPSVPVVRGFVTQLYIGEDSRFAEEGVSVESELQEIGPLGVR